MQTRTLGFDELGSPMMVTKWNITQAPSQSKDQASVCKEWNIWQYLKYEKGLCLERSFNHLDIVFYHLIFILSLERSCNFAEIFLLGTISPSDRTLFSPWIYHLFSFFFSCRTLPSIFCVCLLCRFLIISLILLNFYFNKNHPPPLHPYVLLALSDKLMIPFHILPTI